jgi:F420-dependent oxidoreductase-like protein
VPEIAIMVEGQAGLTWPRWQRMAGAVENLGFVGLYRSDHFTNANPPDQDSLELWVSLTWLAANTSRIEFGPLVTPFSFRHPAFTVRMATAVDDLSGGRLTLGLGAGWQEREHHLYGFELLDMEGRFARFQEGLECVSRLLQTDGAVTFEGKYFQFREAQVLPRPRRPHGPPILIGGNGFKRTLSLAARYASEWNANFMLPEQFKRASRHLDELLEVNGRTPASVKRSMMTGCVYAKDAGSLKAKLEARGRSVDELRGRGILVGAGREFADQLHGLFDAGVQRLMLQWLDLDDLAGLESLAGVVLA